MVTYTYDRWGNLISSGGSLKDTVGKLNPFRYRGYYYDAETGLYYLQSRYYNPKIGRFISKDDQSYHDGETGVGANLYAYCGNNPVNMSDPSGHMAFWTRMYHIAHGVWLITTGLIAIVSAIRKGFVASALGSITARVLGSLVGVALGMMPIGQYWGTIINVTIIIAMLWRVKALLYNIPKGLFELKSAF